jgi:hypothetical protein
MNLNRLGTLVFLACALTLGLVGYVPNVFANASASSAQENKRAVEFTFIKSLPGKREQLVKFIDANWFAMDSIAVKQGLMRGYRMLDSGDDAEPWNIVVMVTYPDAGGYEAIKTKFEEIRKAHTKVLIDGMDFRELGRVVESRKLLEPK